MIEDIEKLNILKIELNELILKYSYPCHTPLPEPFYQKEELKHNRNITYCAFIEVDGVRRILKKANSNYFIGLNCDFNEYTNTGREILENILEDILEPVYYENKKSMLEDELVLDPEAIQNLVHVLSPTTNITLKRPDFIFRGDGNYDAEHYWKDSDVFECLFHLLKQYLKYEVANYEKYNPEWWLKGDEVKGKLFEEIVINKSADDLVEMLIRNGQWTQRGLDNEDWEMIKILGLGDDIEKLILTFAMGRPGKESIKNEIRTFEP